MRRLGDDFDAFVRDASPGLLRFAFRLTGDQQLAEDMVQACLWRVAKRWSSVRDSPVGYARQSLVNAAKDGWRARRRRPTEVPVEGWNIPVVEEPDGVLIVESRNALVAALRGLPVRQRTIIALRYWEGLSVEETAHLLNCSAGTVKSTASRGLKQLRKTMNILETES